MTKTFPALISAKYQHYIDSFRAVENNAEWLNRRLTNFPEYPLFAVHLQLVWGCSDFVAQDCLSQPALFRALVESGDLQRSYSATDYEKAIPLPEPCNEEQLAKTLRLFRRRELIRIIWRDFTRQATMQETTADMTWMAEAAISAALLVLHPITCRELGTPLSSADGASASTIQRMVVIAMGKMGAYELNVSSDIDLIFTYPNKGETSWLESGVARKTVSNQEFFTRLGQKLIAALDRKTADGFVFRVDMALRPYGQSGALVMSFDALEEYYLTQGREWERYAMVKARVVSGATADREQLDAILRPFVYRRYLDFGAIEALRDLKKLINREVMRKGLQDDIKLGAGGIREVEFIVQAFQLVRGGRNISLQTQSLHTALQQLVKSNIVAENDALALWRAYEFLRNTEHALQGIGNQQTQQLPLDELGRQRVAILLNSDSWGAFSEQLQEHRRVVKSMFGDIFADPSDAAASGHAGEGAGENAGERFWSGDLTREEIVQYLQRQGYQEAEPVAQQLYDMYTSKAVVTLEKEPRSRLDKLMPNLTAVCAPFVDNSTTLARVVALVQAVLRRSAYLALLTESPRALEQLALLCERSSWIAAELTAYPALLDELLDPRSLYMLPTKAILQDQLRQQMLRVSSDDLEQQMEVVRYFVRSSTLRIAACDVTGVIPLMQVSDYLTWLAEVVIEYSVNISWEYMLSQYGEPQSDGAEPPAFVVVAYGKLGGIELGYKSDLDLVFLYSGASGMLTNGARSIDNSTFFVRLGQRIIHILTTMTRSGAAYEIDMRLRPSGNSGMLVSSIAGFAKYQRESAWTWEHQALVRARVVAGDRQLTEAFNALRQEILCRSRDKASLAVDVQEMREKMRTHLGRATKDGKFSLKQGAGGIVDIEFMVQFAVLAWSHQYPTLARWSDTIRILESLAQNGLFTEQQSAELIDAYKRYRSEGHRLQLQNLAAEVDDSQLQELREKVGTQWRQLFNSH